jgi:hypothetical protein
VEPAGAEVEIGIRDGAVTLRDHGPGIDPTDLPHILAPGDTNGHFDVFIHDRVSGLTDLVSIRSNEAQGNAPSTAPAVSRDGEFVAFKSFAANLVSDDTNGSVDVFVRNRTAGTTERVSVNSAERQANGASQEAAGIGFPRADRRSRPTGVSWRSIPPRPTWWPGTPTPVHLSSMQSQGGVRTCSSETGSPERRCEWSATSYERRIGANLRPQVTSRSPLACLVAKTHLQTNHADFGGTGRTSAARSPDRTARNGTRRTRRHEATGLITQRS